MPIRPYSEWLQRGDHFHTHILKRYPEYAFTWEAICPIANQLIEGYTEPTEEQMQYVNYRNTTEDQYHPMDFRIWLREPYLMDNGKFAPCLNELSILINDGDDSYWHKEYAFTIENYDEYLSIALKEFEWLKLAVTADELLDLAMTLGFSNY